MINTMNIRVIIFLLILFTAGCKPSSQYQETIYHIDATISPDEHFLSVNLKLNYNVDEASDSLIFYLHKNLKINNLKCDYLKDYKFIIKDTCTEAIYPEAGTLVIYFNKPLLRNERISLEMDYAGNINITKPDGINRITEEWTELNRYAPWFPEQVPGQSFYFAINAKISSDYQIASNGNIHKINNLRQIFTDIARKDIVIMASKKLKQKSNTKEDLTSVVSYININDSTAADINNQSLWILDQYNNWFGKVKDNDIKIVIPPRDKGQNYTSRGFIVMRDIKDTSYYNHKRKYIKYLAREIARLWWSDAPEDSWEDWLNESLAEYTSMMAIRKKFGEKYYDKLIKEKQKNSLKLPPVKSTDLTSEEAHKVFNNKGCIYLYELENETGKEQFMKLLKSVSRDKINSTRGFLDKLGSLTNDQIKQKYAEKLSE